MFTPTLRCECAQPGLIDTMRKWSTDHVLTHARTEKLRNSYFGNTSQVPSNKLMT